MSLDKNIFKNLYNIDKINNLHENLAITSTELDKIKKLFINLDKYLLANNEIFLRYYWYKFLDKRGNPASNLPWGEIVALDPVSGKIKWRTKTGNINYENENRLGTPSYGGSL